MEQYFYKSRWVDSVELHWTVKNRAFCIFNLPILLWGDKSCGCCLFVPSLDKDRCSSFQSLLEIFGAVMFHVKAAVKEKNSFRCLGGPVWSWWFAKLFAWKRMLCHSGLKSSWELAFLQAVGRIGEPIGLRQRKHKFTLPKGACSCCYGFWDGASWCQIVTCSFPPAEYKINFLWFSADTCLNILFGSFLSCQKGEVKAGDELVCFLSDLNW